MCTALSPKVGCVICGARSPFSFCYLCEAALSKYRFDYKDYEQKNEFFFRFTETSRDLKKLRKLGFFSRARNLYFQSILLLRIFDLLKE